MGKGDQALIEYSNPLNVIRCVEKVLNDGTTRSIVSGSRQGLREYVGNGERQEREENREGEREEDG